MLKTILAVVGVIAVLLVALVVGGGYFAVKKGGAALLRSNQQQINTFIDTKHPPEAVANSLRRLVNAVTLSKHWSRNIFMAMALGTIGDGVVSREEVQMLDEASALVEQGDSERMNAFFKKHQGVSQRPTPRQP